MNRLGALVLALLLVAGGAAAGTRCAPGTFDPLISSVDGYPLAGGGTFAIGVDTITMGACGTTTLGVRAGRRYTRYRALWEACPGFGRIRYQGWTNYPPCKALVSLLRWRDQSTSRRRALKFEALRAGE